MLGHSSFIAITVSKKTYSESSHVLKILYDCLMIIQYESKHVAIQSDILFEIQLCWTDAFYCYFALSVSAILLLENVISSKS
jgi:hypothetical protein